ncbi:hypothetical protein [Sphingobacterium zeae]|uniref:Uncharacterized protein n=1 Tax=Sphingobacterium zeae TaxID=1776859 RepID=A0ABU0U9V0_9SPHI|nr:hypothetical protein [Sphingobacterium zeae]MDQ1151647.1 hypothetical protein [Sphingobacterium zeae]
MGKFEINSLIERRKCRATGKVRFNSRSEASFFIHWLKWCYKKWLRGKIEGSTDMAVGQESQSNAIRTVASTVVDIILRKSIRMITGEKKKNMNRNILNN